MVCSSHRIYNTVMAPEFADDFARRNIPEENLSIATTGRQPGMSMARMSYCLYVLLTF